MNEKDWISELDKSRVAKLTNSDAFDELFQLEKVLEMASRLQLPRTSQELSGGGIIVDETSSDFSDDGNEAVSKKDESNFKRLNSIKHAVK